MYWGESQVENQFRQKTKLWESFVFKESWSVWPKTGCSTDWWSFDCLKRTDNLIYILFFIALQEPKQVSRPILSTFATLKFLISKPRKSDGLSSTMAGKRWPEERHWKLKPKSSRSLSTMTLVSPTHTVQLLCSDPKSSLSRIVSPFLWCIQNMAFTAAKDVPEHRLHQNRPKKANERIHGPLRRATLSAEGQALWAKLCWKIKYAGN